MQFAQQALGQWGGVKEFLEKSASQFSALSIVDDPTMAPTLQLRDDSEEDEGPAGGISISVAAYKYEHIEALLKAKLRGADADS